MRTEDHVVLLLPVEGRAKGDIDATELAFNARLAVYCSLPLEGSPTLTFALAATKH